MRLLLPSRYVAGTHASQRAEVTRATAFADGRRELLAAYDEEQLRTLLERVRYGFARPEAAEINAFELDDLIHQCKRAARELWSSSISSPIPSGP
jgi:hypothetical protein